MIHLCENKLRLITLGSWTIVQYIYHKIAEL